MHGGSRQLEDCADLRVGLAARHPAHGLQFTSREIDRGIELVAVERFAALVRRVRQREQQRAIRRAERGRAAGK